jgi:hypothetical protein
MSRTVRTFLAAGQEVPRSRGRKKAGRPATGPGGERVSDYPQVMIRLPQQTKTTLETLSAASGVPVWKLVDRAVAVYVRQLPAGERRLIGMPRASRGKTTVES